MKRFFFAILLLLIFGQFSFAQCTCTAGCSSLTVITMPFTKDGTGEFCYQASCLGASINSWNMGALVINGTDFTNKWANSSTYPAAASDGMYYIYYNGSLPYSHFEALGTCSGTTTAPTSPPSDTIAATADPTAPTSETLGPTDAPTVTSAPTATPGPTSVPTATPAGVTADPTTPPDITPDPTALTTTPPDQTAGPTDPPGSMSFITRSGSTLYDGSTIFRFVSVNIPNYFILEDRAGTSGSKWHRVTEFEQRDACFAVKALGGQVFRTYVFSVQGGVNVENNLAHIYKSGSSIVYNESLFTDVDKGLAVAKEQGVRMYIPLVDNWAWFGGYAEWASISGGSDFWNDTVCKTAFKSFINWLVNRTNTVTGVQYKNDPTIMGWELGNEIDKANATWITEIAAYIKSVDSNHLVIDGGHKSIPSASLSSASIDIVTTHYTDGDISANTTTAKNSGKAYIYGEFQPTDSSTVSTIVSTTISSGAAGCLAWSLRFRTDIGGFYYHSDFNGASDSLQYPGFSTTMPSNEAAIYTTLRNGAYQIRGLSAPTGPIPPAPILLPITSASAINWKGSAAANSYTLQRSTSSSGPWTDLATNISDAKYTSYDGQYVAQLPLYSDYPGSGTFYYRVIAYGSGASNPSNVVSVTQ